LYFSCDVLAEHLGRLQQYGYVVHSFDCSVWSCEEDFHSQVSRQLNFPSYYGRNLPAFHDCLSGVEVPEVGGVALAFLSFDLPFTKFPDWSRDILDIIAVNSRRFSLTGQRLLALVQSNDPGIEIGPVGACPVALNPTEFGWRIPPVGPE
jgi:RNAse (barnase) inhibitor barstar